MSCSSCRSTPCCCPSKTYGARVTRASGNLSPVINTRLILTFDTERFDVGAFFVVSAPTRLTAKKKGIYMIGGSVEWSTPDETQGIHRSLGILLNGTTIIDLETEAPIESGPLRQSISTVYKLSAGDYLELYVWEDGDSVILKDDAFSPEFYIVKQ